MASNPYVNKVQKADGSVIIDISDTTAVASDVASGKYFYTASGTKTAGTASGGGGVIITDTQDAAGGTIRTITSGSSLTLTSLSATSNQTYTAPSGTAYNEVVVNVSGGGGTIPWWGCGDEELLHTTNHELKLSDTNWASLTPSTSNQSLTLPATAYSESGINPIVDEYSLNIDLANYGLVFVTESFCEMKYSVNEATMSLAHALVCAVTNILYYGLTVNPNETSTFGGIVSASVPFSSVKSRDSYNNITGTTTNYGFSLNEGYALPSLTASNGVVSKIQYKMAARVRSSASFMNTSAWSNVDATNTKLKTRIRTYRVAYPGLKTGISGNIIYMLNNSAFPTD